MNVLDAHEGFTETTDVVPEHGGPATWWRVRCACGNYTPWRWTEDQALLVQRAHVIAVVATSN